MGLLSHKIRLKSGFQWLNPILDSQFTLENHYSLVKKQSDSLAESSICQYGCKVKVMNPYEGYVKELQCAHNWGWCFSQGSTNGNKCSVDPEYLISYEEQSWEGKLCNQIGRLTVVWVTLMTEFWFLIQSIYAKWTDGNCSGSLYLISVSGAKWISEDSWCCSQRKMTGGTRREIDKWKGEYRTQWGSYLIYMKWTKKRNQQK